jgi:hypothetical protein
MTADTGRKCWNCGDISEPCYDGGTPWCVKCGVVDNPSKAPHPLGAFYSERPRIPELTRVRVVSEQRCPSCTIPAGTYGTVVGTYVYGLAYEVEFAEPYNTTVTMTPDQITEAPDDR